MAPCDYRKYPPDWPAIRSRIRARAGERCEWCGVENGGYYVTPRGGDRYRIGEGAVDAANHDGDRVTRIVLTVAHLNHDITDNRDENLAALCQRCHLGYDAEHHKRNAAATRRRKREAGGQGVLL